MEEDIVIVHKFISRLKEIKNKDDDVGNENSLQTLFFEKN